MGGSVCSRQCLEHSSEGPGSVPGAARCAPPLYLPSLHWGNLGFPTLPLLAPGSSHRLGDMIVFLAACYIISPEGFFFFLIFPGLSWEV